MLVAKRLIRLDAVFIKHYDLARFHIPHKFRINCVQGTCLGRQNITVVSFSDNQWAESIGISCPDQFTRTRDDQGIRSLQFHHRIFYCLLCRRRMKAFARDQIRDHFRIDRCMENSSGIFHLFTQFMRVDQVSIVSKHKCTFDIVEHKRLHILAVACPCCRIAHMTYSNISFQF